MVCWAIGVGYTSGAVDVKIGPALVAGTAMIIAVITLVRNPTFGFYFLIAFSAFTSLIDRLVTLPLPSGTFIDIITYILLLTILLNYDLKSKIDGKFWTNPISIGIYITFAYYLIEMFNTDMFSKLGWFSYFRKQISYVVIYYVSYTILDSKKKIIYFVRFMIVLTTLTAIYACKQQYLGYAGFEMRSIGPRGMAPPLPGRSAAQIFCLRRSGHIRDFVCVRHDAVADPDDPLFQCGRKKMAWRSSGIQSHGL